MTIQKRESTRIPAGELAGMKKDRIGGATWSELEQKYGYHRTTITRAVKNNLKDEPTTGGRMNIRFTDAQIAAYKQFGGSAYIRNLIDRDIAARARNG